MAKYGRGLNREIGAAVNLSELSKPLTTASLRQLAVLRGWKPAESLVQVALANAASDDRSPTYRQYLHSPGRGQYQVRDEYRGPARG